MEALHEEPLKGPRLMDRGRVMQPTKSSVCYKSRYSDRPPLQSEGGVSAQRADRTAHEAPPMHSII